MVTEVEIRDYAGDFEDVAALAAQVWNDAYRGKLWFTLWDAPFLRWQFGPGSPGLNLGIFDGATLVGSFLVAPHTLRIGSSAYRVGLASWCIVHPSYRSLALTTRLINALRRRHGQEGLAFSLGFVSSDPRSFADRFWSKYAGLYPRNLQFVSTMPTWVKILNPSAFVRAAIEPWERIAARTFGIFARTGARRDESVRPFNRDDLGACAELVVKTSEKAACAIEWSHSELAAQLEGHPCRSLVLDHKGRASALVNYHECSVHGREPLRAALIDIYADGDLARLSSARFLGQACADMRERGFDLVLALRSATTPTAAFVANLFMPYPAEARLAAIFPRTDISLPNARSSALMLR